MNIGFGQGNLGMGPPAAASGGGLFDFSSTITRIFGLSMFASVFTGVGGGGFGENGIKLFVFGILVEFARRFVQWIMERFRLRACSIRPRCRLLINVSFKYRIFNHGRVQRGRPGV